MPYVQQKTEFVANFRNAIYKFSDACDSFRNLKHYFDTANLKAAFENVKDEEVQGATLDEVYKALEITDSMNKYLDGNGYWEVVNLLK